MVPWLLANPGVTVGEAARRFGVTAQQIKQDLDDICESETPGLFFDNIVRIQYWRSDDGFDDDCPIFVHQPLNFDRPTQLSADRAAQLLLGLDVVAQLLGTSSPAIASARGKLAEVAQQRVDSPVVLNLGAENKAAFQSIMTALAAQSCVEIEYLPGDRDAVTRRVIEPVSVDADAGVTVIHAWCQNAQAMRRFRLDRVLTARASEVEPHKPERTTASTDLADSAELVLQVTAPVKAAWVFDGLPGTRVVPTQSGVIAEVPAGSAEWAIRWGLAHAGVVEVLEPSQVREAISSRLTTLKALTHPSG
jgi:proteasome accessory factor C